MKLTSHYSLVVLIALTALMSNAAGASFDSLGDLSGGTFSSVGHGVSPDGGVVVGSSNSGSGWEAFRWTADGMAGLGDLPGGGFYSVATGVSAGGAVVVGEGRSGAGDEAFRWTAGGMVGLGDLPGDGFGSRADAVSANGSVVVGQGLVPGGAEAFRWTQPSGMVGLGDLPGGAFISIARGVSADGAVVVGQGRSASGGQAFRWTQGGGMVGLGDLPGGSSYSSGDAVSANGSVVVGYAGSASGNEAYRWTQATGMVGLGDLPGGTFNSRAYGASADGSIVVGYGHSASGQEAFIWDANNGIRKLKNVLTNAGLDLTGWTLTAARAVSNGGATIVGYGTNPDGDHEGWVAYLSDKVYWYPDHGGAWDSTVNWTGPRAPTAAYDAIIAPNAGATITGPTSAAAAKSLIIGGALGAATLRTNGGGDLTIADMVIVETNGTLDHEQGVFSADAIANDGSVDVAASMNVTQFFDNTGDLDVYAGGVLSTGAGLTNSGSLAVTGGAISGGLTNYYGAMCFARGMISAGLTNYGQLSLTGMLMVSGQMDNYGSVDIGLGESLVQSGGLDNYGTIELSGGGIIGGGTFVNRPGGIVRGGSAIQKTFSNAGGLVHANGASTLLIVSMTSNSAGGEMRIDDGAGINVVSGFSNASSVVLKGAGATLTGGTIANTGTIRGQGWISNTISNSGFVRAESDMLTLAGPFANNASGTIESLAGATVFVSQGLADNQGAIILNGGAYDNNAKSMSNNGNITGHGTLRTGELTNTSHVGVGGGDMDVIGDVINNGTVYVAGGYSATFFSDVSGSGSFTGTGTAVFLGAIKPGSSPGKMTFAGDVVLTGASELEIELGGTTAGSEHDAIDVAGNLTLAGAMDVLLIGGFDPGLGDSFDLLDWGSLSGVFDEVNLPGLSGGLDWNISSLYTTGAISVVPEPAALSLLAVGGLVLLKRRCRS